MFVILMFAASPLTALTVVVMTNDSLGFTVAATGDTLTSSLSAAAVLDSEGEGVVVARADAPPVARMAAVPRPMNTGLTADRQITAAAPPSRRR